MEAPPPQSGSPGRLLVALTVSVGFWSLTGLNSSVFGLPTAGRYQYIGVVGLVLVAAELGARKRHRPLGDRFRPRRSALAASLANVSRLKDSAHGLDGIAQQQRGGLAALELARDPLPPDLSLTQENSGVDYLGLLDAGSYLRRWTPSARPLTRRPSSQPLQRRVRSSADRVSALALLAPASYRRPASRAPIASRFTLSLRPAVIPVPSEGSS